jgi:hypothetical protein
VEGNRNEGHEEEQGGEVAEGEPEAQIEHRRILDG